MLEAGHLERHNEIASVARFAAEAISFLVDVSNQTLGSLRVDLRRLPKGGDQRPLLHDYAPGVD